MTGFWISGVLKDDSHKLRLIHAVAVEECGEEN